MRTHPAPQVHKRSARLVYLPAYIMEYSYGEKYVAGDSTGTIVPELFTALVGGTRGGRVAAELHPSATKVQLTVGGGMIGLGYGLGPAFSQLTGLPALVNLDLVGLTFWSFLVASFVGEWGSWGWRCCCCCCCPGVSVVAYSMSCQCSSSAAAECCRSEGCKCMVGSHIRRTGSCQDQDA